MNIDDAKTRAVARAIANAIGYAEGSTFLPSLPEIVEGGENDLLTARILQVTESDELGAGDHAYVAPGFNHAAVRIGERVAHVPAFDIIASGKARIAHWPMGEDNISDAQRVGIVLRFLSDMRRSFRNSHEKLAVRLLTQVAKDENQQLDWSNSQGEIMSRVADGWSLVLPYDPGKAGLTLDLRTFGHRFVQSPHVEKRFGFVVGPKQDLGVWRRPDGEVPVMAWADGKELTYGLSAYIMRGIAIRDSRLVVGINLGDHPSLD